MKEFLNKIKNLMEGWNVDLIDYPEKSSEFVCRFHLSKNNKKRSFVLCGNDLGNWFEQIKDNGNSYSFGTFVDDINNAINRMDFNLIDNNDSCFVEEDDKDTIWYLPPSYITPLENVLKRKLGFRLVPTGEEWYIDIVKIQEEMDHPYAKYMLEPEGRKKLALEFCRNIFNKEIL